MAKRVKGGQKLVKSARTSRMQSSIKKARENDRKYREGKKLQKAFEKQQRRRPRKKSDWSLASGSRTRRPSA